MNTTHILDIQIDPGVRARGHEAGKTINETHDPDSFKSSPDGRRGKHGVDTRGRPAACQYAHSWSDLGWAWHDDLHKKDGRKWPLNREDYPPGAQVDILGPPVNPAVFLDRDNTLIANSGDLGDPSKVVLLDGVVQGLLRLHEHGYTLVVVTNQGGVARGHYGEADVRAVHQEISRIVQHQSGSPELITRYYYCPFHPEGNIPEYRREHPWRKPQPGMLLQASRELDLDLSRSWMVGDQDRDVEAGQAAGCRTLLLATEPSTDKSTQADAIAPDLREAAEIILTARQP